MKKTLSDVKVYVTEDYNGFKKLLGNREVTEERVAAIMTSMEDVGYMMSPILVNERLETIDGQGRLEALQRLGWPVYYIIQKGAGIDECIAMNIKMKNWKVGDFVNSYATRGYEDYIKLVELHEKYPYHTYQTIYRIMAGTLDRGGVDKKIKNGHYAIVNEKNGRGCLAFIDSIHEKIESLPCRCSSVYDVLSGLYFKNLIDTKQMTEQFNKYADMCASYMGDVESCLDSLQTIYNYRKRTPIRFKDTYLTVMDETRSRFGLAKRTKSEA